MKLFSICLLIFLFKIDSCTDQQLLESRLAENAYLELIYAVEIGETESAIAAADKLEERLAPLRGKWRRPMNRANSLQCRLHLDEAEKSFADAKAALKADNLVAAKILIARATDELDAADHESFTRLYCGLIYDFYSTWTEVDLIVNDQMLCLMEWKEYVWWANMAQSEWQRIECEEPNPVLYNFSPAQNHTFAEARNQLSQALDDFSQNINRGDQCSSQEYAAEVTTALWVLLMSIDTSPPVSSEILD